MIRPFIKNNICVFCNQVVDTTYHKCLSNYMIDNIITYNQANLLDKFTHYSKLNRASNKLLDELIIINNKNYYF